ncbi:MAG: HDOD domain-containing protein [Syntrophobacteraceae bacterium]
MPLYRAYGDRLSSIHREKVAAEIARAFHSAAQAKNLAMKRGLARPEEVFIAALLTRIGQIAFWCFAGEIGDKLECAIKMSKQEEQAELDVLGFKLERLSVELSREWKLSGLMESVLQNTNATDPRVQCISMGCGIAQGAEKSWNSAQVKKEVGGYLTF